jgi:hypothetical protein
VYKPSKTTIQRSHCFGNVTNKLLQWTIRNTYQRRNDLKYYCVSKLPISFIIIPKIYLLLVAEAPYLRMSITFKNEADIVLWVLARLIKNFHSKLYWFEAQCVWWLSALIGLSPALVFYLKHDNLPSELISINNKLHSDRILEQNDIRDIQITITFENDNNVIVYTFEMIILFQQK